MVRIIKQMNVPTDVVTAIKCDACLTVYEDSFDLQEFLCYSDVGGYGSRIGDQVKKEIDLCESCVQELLGKYLRTKRVDDDWDIYYGAAD